MEEEEKCENGDILENTNNNEIDSVDEEKEIIDILAYLLPYSDPVPLPMLVYRDIEYNNIRRCKLILFGNILNQHNEFKEFSYAKKSNIIMKIEKSCFNSANKKIGMSKFDIRRSWDNTKFVTLYHDICYKVSSGLDKNVNMGSGQLLESIINGEINIDRIGFMDAEDLYPEQYKKYREKIYNKYNLQEEPKTSSLYRCRKCKKNNCTIRNRYNRSLDEGVNITITCVNCGSSWNG
jgi:DNA-directed RNA polymerase subunit M/transcription elongation factor TFIIS